jgi:hypothetical protein
VSFYFTLSFERCVSFSQMPQNTLRHNPAVFGFRFLFMKPSLLGGSINSMTSNSVIPPGFWSPLVANFFPSRARPKGDRTESILLDIRSSGPSNDSDFDFCCQILKVTTVPKRLDMSRL